MTVETATQILEDLSLKDDKKDDSVSKLDPPSSKGQNPKRRRPWAPRSIPREYLAGKDSSRKRPQRRRTESEMSPRHNRRSVRGRTTSEVSTTSEPSKDALPMRKLRDTVMEKFDKKGSNMLASYLKNRRELASFESKTRFLLQCKAVEVVPMPHRLTNFNIKNTKVIRRILDKFSLQLMLADLVYCRKRCEQIKRLLGDRVDSMKEMFGEELFEEIVSAADGSAERHTQQLKERHTESFNCLVTEYKLSEEDIKIGDERMKLFETLDKERRERRLQKLKEKESKPEEKSEGGSDRKSESAAEAEPEVEKKTQE